MTFKQYKNGIPVIEATNAENFEVSDSITVEDSVTVQNSITVEEIYTRLDAPLIVAVQSSSGMASSSSDYGTTWTEFDTGLFPFTRIAYGNGKFVGVGNYSDGMGNGYGAYSTDAITWTQTTLPSMLGRSVTHGDGKFVAVAYNSSTAAYSTDGITWTQTTMPGIYKWQSVTHGDGKFVVVAYNSSTAAHSTDGITWTQITMPGSGVYSWYALVHDGRRFFAARQDGVAAYSTDGTAWTEVTTMTNRAWVGLASGIGNRIAKINGLIYP